MKKALRRFWPAVLFVTLVSCGIGSPPILAAHSVVLTWTAPTSMPTGSYINIYRGTTSGGEAVTAINSSGISPTSLTYTDSNVLANTKYYYIAKQCDIDISSNTEVCSAASNEASATVPLSSGDLAIVVGLGAVGK